MSEHAPIPLTPVPIEVMGREFADILCWPFADTYVTQLLREDIPRRVKFGYCQVWTYMDPAGRSVGFGTLDICDDWADFSDNAFHPYIPLLATNPNIRSLGYGSSIVRHLIAEAAILANRICTDTLFLDVYKNNTKAIDLYEKFGFVKVVEEAFTDPDQDDALYFVMAKIVSVAQVEPRG